MAARTIAVTGNADMSSIASTATGVVTGSGLVLVQFDDSYSKTDRAAALRRLTEKLAEEGWI